MKIKKIIRENKKHSNKIISGVITAFILGVLILSGPASAFELGLSINDSTIEKGDDAVFTATININSGENLPIDEISLVINGEENRICVFNVDGSPISGCEGIHIELIDSGAGYGYGYDYGYWYGYGYDFGYGYGYGSGELRYRITIDTDYFSVGDYDALLRTLIDSKTFDSDGVNFSIYSVNKSSNTNENNGGCITDWVCSGWSSCIDGQQIRDCNKEDIFCYANPEDKPIEQRSCTVGTQTGNVETNETGIQTLGTDTNTDNGGLSRITGAVIGAGATSWIVIVVFIVGILGLSLTVRMVRKRRRIRFR